MGRNGRRGGRVRVPRSGAAGIARRLRRGWRRDGEDLVQPRGQDGPGLVGGEHADQERRDEPLGQEVERHGLAVRVDAGCELSGRFGYPGMAHALPRPLRPAVIDEIAAVTGVGVSPDL
jgi:hypothetical protein